MATRLLGVNSVAETFRRIACDFMVVPFFVNQPASGFAPLQAFAEPPKPFRCIPLHLILRLGLYLTALTHQQLW